MEQTDVSPEVHLALTRVLPACRGWKRAQRRGQTIIPEQV